MAARRGRLSKPDAQGKYVRQLGWKLNSNGERTQHKFRLGSDKREAEQRDSRLQQLWNQIEQETTVGNPLWDELTLEIAKQIALGEAKVQLAPLSDDEAATDYARRLQRIQNRFAFLRFAPTDEQRYAAGLGDKIRRGGTVLYDTDPEINELLNRRSNEWIKLPPLQPESPTARGGDPLTELFGASYQPLTAPNAPKDDGATLHDAFEAYKNWIRNEYFDNSTQDVSEYGHTKLGQVDTLKDRHKNVPLAEIDYDFIEAMYRFWRKRPKKKSKNGNDVRISPTSIRHYLGELHRFFKWVHRSKSFAWRKPEDFDEINRSIPSDAETIKRRIQNVDTFRLEDLQLLNRYATPTERLFLLLALNCGFGAREIATLTIGEVFLHQALPAEEQEVFDFPSTDADSFISLVRQKTNIVGKFMLFSQTVQMLEWAVARRLKQPNPASDQPLILNRGGRPLDKRSASGYPSRHIPNSFIQLKKRIEQDGKEVANLPFKCLRKTAGDLIRRFSDGEVSGVFLLHGKPVQSDKLADIYTNRPFGKVYRAIRQVEEFLKPMFAEVTGDPTSRKRNADETPDTTGQLAELVRSGKSIREIAQETGQARMTVQRQIKKLGGVSSGHSNRDSASEPYG